MTRGGSGLYSIVLTARFSGVLDFRYRLATNVQTTHMIRFLRERAIKCGKTA